MDLLTCCSDTFYYMQSMYLELPDWLSLCKVSQWTHNLQTNFLKLTKARAFYSMVGSISCYEQEPQTLLSIKQKFIYYAVIDHVPDWLLDFICCDSKYPQLCYKWAFEWAISMVRELEFIHKLFVNAGNKLILLCGNKIVFTTTKSITVSWACGIRNYLVSYRNGVLDSLYRSAFRDDNFELLQHLIKIYPDSYIDWKYAIQNNSLKCIKILLHSDFKQPDRDTIYYAKTLQMFMLMNSICPKQLPDYRDLSNACSHVWLLKKLFRQKHIKFTKRNLAYSFKREFYTSKMSLHQFRKYWRFWRQQGWRPNWNALYNPFLLAIFNNWCWSVIRWLFYQMRYYSAQRLDIYKKAFYASLAQENEKCLILLTKHGYCFEYYWKRLSRMYNPEFPILRLNYSFLSKWLQPPHNKLRPAILDMLSINCSPDINDLLKQGWNFSKYRFLSILYMCTKYDSLQLPLILEYQGHLITDTLIKDLFQLFLDTCEDHSLGSVEWIYKQNKPRFYQILLRLADKYNKLMDILNV